MVLTLSAEVYRGIYLCLPWGADGTDAVCRDAGRGLPMSATVLSTLYDDFMSVPIVSLRVTVVNIQRLEYIG